MQRNVIVDDQGKYRKARRERKKKRKKKKVERSVLL